MDKEQLVPIEELIDWDETPTVSIELDTLKRLIFADGAILTKRYCVTRPKMYPDMVAITTTRVM